MEDLFVIWALAHLPKHKTHTSIVVYILPTGAHFA